MLIASSERILIFGGGAPARRNARRANPGPWPLAPSPSLLPVPAHRHALPLDRGLLERADHLVGDLVRHLDQGEAVGDLDRADGARVDPDFVGDRANQVTRANAELATRPHVDARHLPLRLRARATRSFATRGA